MAVINIGGEVNDANDGLLVRNPERIGNRKYGQRMFLSGQEQPFITIGSFAVVGPQIIPGVGTAAAYAAGEQMGTVISFLVPEVGTILDVRFHDLDDEGLDKELWLFNSSPTLAADNAAFTIGDADNANVVAVFLFSTWRDAANSQVGFTSNTPATYVTPAGKLWGALTELASYPDLAVEGIGGEDNYEIRYPAGINDAAASPTRPRSKKARIEEAGLGELVISVPLFPASTILPSPSAKTKTSASVSNLPNAVINSPTVMY